MATVTIGILPNERIEQRMKDPFATKTPWQVVQLPSGLYTLRRTWHGWEQEFPLAWRSRDWAEHHARFANDPGVTEKTRTSLNHRRDSELEESSGTIGEMGERCLACDYDRMHNGVCGWCGAS